MELPIHPVDILFGIYLAGATLHGFRRGWWGEIFAFIRTVVALGVAWYYVPRVGTFIALHTRLSHEPSARLLAFVLIFIGTSLALFLFGLLLKIWVEFKTKPSTERLGGLAFGFVRGAVVLAVFVVVVSLSGTTYIKEQVTARARIGSTLDHYLTPAYVDLAETHPGLRLPLPAPRPEPAPAEGAP